MGVRVANGSARGGYGSLAGRSGARRPPVKPTAGYLCLGRLDATAQDLKRLSGDEAHTVGVEQGASRCLTLFFVYPNGTLTKNKA